MCIGLDLVSNTGRVISQLKIGRPHQHVPPGKQHTKVVPAQDNLSGISGVAELATFWGLNGFMPYADTVVPAVKSGLIQSRSPMEPNHRRRLAC